MARRWTGCLEGTGKAFDFAWEDIADTFGNDPLQIETAPQACRRALSIASEASRDAEVLRRAASKRMAIDTYDD
jgi:hypothetical protein